MTSILKLAHDMTKTEDAFIVTTAALYLCIEQSELDVRDPLRSVRLVHERLPRSLPGPFLLPPASPRTISGCPSYVLRPGTTPTPVGVSRSHLHGVLCHQ